MFCCRQFASKSVIAVLRLAIKSANPAKVSPHSRQVADIFVALVGLAFGRLSILLTRPWWVCFSLTGDGSDTLFILEFSCRALTVAFVEASNVFDAWAIALLSFTISLTLFIKDRTCFNCSKLPAALAKACSEVPSDSCFHYHEQRILRSAGW